MSGDRPALRREMGQPHSRDGGDDCDRVARPRVMGQPHSRDDGDDCGQFAESAAPAAIKVRHGRQGPGPPRIVVFFCSFPAGSALPTERGLPHFPERGFLRCFGDVLLVAKRRDRVEMHGSARGHEACGPGDRRKRQDETAQHEGVGAGSFYQRGANQLTDSHDAGESDD